MKLPRLPRGGVAFGPRRERRLRELKKGVARTRLDVLRVHRSRTTSTHHTVPTNVYVARLRAAQSPEFRTTREVTRTTTWTTGKTKTTVTEKYIPQAPRPRARGMPLTPARGQTQVHRRQAGELREADPQT